MFIPQAQRVNKNISDGAVYTTSPQWKLADFRWSCLYQKGKIGTGKTLMELSIVEAHSSNSKISDYAVYVMFSIPKRQSVNWQILNEAVNTTTHSGS